jgi:outer membrane protein TolC
MLKRNTRISQTALCAGIIFSVITLPVFSVEQEPAASDSGNNPEQNTSVRKSVTGTALPEPLTLDFVIEQGTRSTHPAMLAAEADLQVATAELDAADSSYDLESNVRLTAGYIDPNDTALDQTHDDNIASFEARKTLYDFGVTSDKVGSAENLVEAGRMGYELARQQQTIVLASQYFDVLLADLKYAWDNENMAMQYVQYDRARERYNLKQVSDVELLQKESNYQIALTQRSASETMQRTSRALLAVAIDRPGELSTRLLKPGLNIDQRILPDLDELISTAIERNNTLKALRKRETSARLAHEAETRQFRPTLNASFEAFDYSRNTPSRDDLRARLNLVIPLTESGLNRSEIARTRATWLQASANVLQYEARLRNKVANYWHDLLKLQSRKKELEVSFARAEIELDKARGEYELEIKTDLGDAMVNISRMNYERARNRYDTALAWMQLSMLTGDDPEDILKLKASVGEPAQ